MMSEASKAATMLPDSTQSERSDKAVTKRKKMDETRGKKKKLKNAKMKKGRVKSQEEERSKDSQRKEGEEYSDLDLTKPFHSIGHYIFDREEMLQQAFQSVSKEQIDTMMPDVLKTCPMEVIKALCLGQLEGMSKKRIFHVLAGEEMLSSSDTDESGNEDEPQVQEEKPQEEEVVPQEEQGDEQMEAVVPNIQETVVPHTNEEHAISVTEYQDDAVLQGEGPSDEAITALAEDYFSASQSPISQEEDQTHGEPFEVEASDPNFDEAEVMLPEGEEEEEEEQQQHAEIPVPRRKRRKKKKNRQPVDPLQLEEGEVDEESSEYTDVSDSDAREDGNGKSEGAVPPEDGGTGVGMDANENCDIIKGTNSAKDIDRTCTKEGDNTPKQLHRNSESEKLELNVQEKTKKTSERTGRGGGIGLIQTMSHLNDADTLSVDDGSGFEDDNQEEIRESGKHEPQGESKSDQPVKNCEKSRISAEREHLDEAGESASSEKEQDGSDSSSSGVEEDEEIPRESKTDSCNVDSEQTDKIKPKLDVLELELRARAIRSLMKHCAVDKQT